MFMRRGGWLCADVLRWCALATRCWSVRLVLFLVVLLWFQRRVLRVLRRVFGSISIGYMRGALGLGCCGLLVSLRD